jgi:cytochrome c oxidase subunit 2
MEVVSTTRRILPKRPVVAGLATLVLATGVASCGGDDTNLSELGQLGKNTANANGCASCHGANGQGGVGPTWIDLAGSEVELTDGTTLIADDDYLLRAILDPDAEEVAGYQIKMPANGLSDAEAANIVTYINELSTESSDAS